MNVHPLNFRLCPQGAIISFTLDSSDSVDRVFGRASRSRRLTPTLKPFLKIDRLPKKPLANMKRSCLTAATLERLDFERSICIQPSTSALSNWSPSALWKTYQDNGPVSDTLLSMRSESS